MKNVGIIIDIDPATGNIRQADFGMITLARQVNTSLFAFVIDADPAIVKNDLAGFGIKKIIHVSLAADMQTNPVVRANALKNAIKKFDIHVLFGLSTAAGKDILPRVAALLEAPLVMDCIDVDLDHNFGKTTQYSGKTVATIKLAPVIQVFGIRPNFIEPVKSEVCAQIVKCDQTHLVSTQLKVITAHQNDTSGKNNLADAEVIISGGRGIKNGENFSMLFQCAEKLGAAVGASRVAVDEGWVPYAMQVGQTGEKVSPKVYIACGISGSIQHFAGMKTSGIVIAVNTDTDAAIIFNCDYYALADAFQIIPELTKLL